MKRIKSTIIASSLGALLALAPISSALAGPAVVNADPNLKFNTANLQTELTKISNTSQVDVTFYSNNFISGNTAVSINDSLIKTIGINNYISIVFNQDATNPAKGSFSVNLGADERDYLSKEEISKNIVQPNIKRYLPQNPQGFIKQVASEIVVTINNKREAIKQAIKTEQDKKNFEDLIFKTVCIVLFLGIAGIVVIILIKKLAAVSKDAKTAYGQVQEQLDICVKLYDKVLNDSSISQGYEGQTRNAADEITNAIVSLSEDYNKISVIPAYKEAFFNSQAWQDYNTNLSAFGTKAQGILSSITTFVSEVSEVKEITKDPLAILQKVRKEKEEKQALVNLQQKASELYNKYELLSMSSVHELYSDLKQTTSYKDATTKFNTFNTAVQSEASKIQALTKAKSTIRGIYDYLTKNINTYYSVPISAEMKDLAQEAYEISINYKNYNELVPLQRYLNTLEPYVLPFNEADALYLTFRKTRDSLIKDFSKFKDKRYAARVKFNVDGLNALQFVRVANYNSNILRCISIFKSELERLVKEQKLIYAKNNIANKYSGTRKARLIQLLENDNYASFDNLVAVYESEDEREAELRAIRARQQQASTVIINNSYGSYGNLYSNTSYGSSSSSDYGSNSSSNDYGSSSSSSNDYGGSSSSNDSYDSGSSGSSTSTDDSWG